MFRERFSSTAGRQLIQSKEVKSACATGFCNFVYFLSEAVDMTTFDVSSIIEPGTPPVEPMVDDGSGQYDVRKLIDTLASYHLPDLEGGQK